MNKIIDKMCDIPSVKQLISGNYRTHRDSLLNTGRDTLGSTVTNGEIVVQTLSEIDYVGYCHLDH